MEGTSTRQRALDAALELFSRRGYEAVSMADIAGALGIKAPSLYKYFKSKEELYAALIPPLEAHYTALWEATARRQEQLERDLSGMLSVERLEQEALAWLQAEMTDPQARAFRRFLTLGQFQSPTPATHWLWLQPLTLYEGFFSRLVSREVLRRGDPHLMALEYLAPLLQLLTLGDRVPDQQGAYLDEARGHIRQFHRIFAHREPRPQSGVSRLFRR